jgi:hypothetical protein
MIEFDQETTATTAQICALAGFTQQRLAALEREGIVHRVGRSQWPLVKTINQIFEHLRARRDAVDQSRAQWQQARLERERLRVEREAHNLVPMTEFDDAWTFVVGTLTAKLAGVPSRCSRDLALRRVIEQEINQARHEACDEYERHAAALSTTGKAA